MTEKQIAIREAMLLFLQQKQSGEKMSMAQLNELFDCGVISDKSALRYIVKMEYYQMMKGSHVSMISGREAICDLSIKWDISDRTIQNIIYKFNDKKGCFPMTKK